ncbi:hypothetical protein GOBAR_DD18086 [Gossypium barbadense]|nr:hypothetical protein GOBAR_DD18086 [Gossypium barbadense]
MENGHDGKLAEKLPGLALNDNHGNNNDDSLSRAVKAIEAAEAVIQQQEEENSRLRYQLEGEYSSRLPQGLMPVPQVNNSNSIWKQVPSCPFNYAVGFSSFRFFYRLRASIFLQDVPIKIREHEEEILQLRKQLAEFSIKEAQIRNEKYVLEKRIAYMRLAFDQQQQDLVDAASKALSYRQDIIEENIRLTYQLQAAQQERTTFVSSLLPLLAEYSLQPPVPDAQSIVSYVKRHEVTSGLVQVLFKHLQEKLIITESKLKDSQYQLAPWRSDVNHSNFTPQSPSHSLGPTLTASHSYSYAFSHSKNGLELMPQPVFSHGKTQIVSDAQTDSNWDLPGQYQGGSGGGIVSKNLEPDDLGRYSPIASRTSTAIEIPTQLAGTQGDTNTVRYGEETINKQVKFLVPVSNSEMDYPDAEGQQIERELPSNWRSGNSPYTPAQDDPSSSYPPYLPPVLEEPSSSFSEAAEDDPLPAIEGLQISGEAYPGRELQACGYSINGTTSCNFEVLFQDIFLPSILKIWDFWVRHMEDGSVNYIEGAKQPNYLVTADDVDTYLAIEVQPLDNRKRKVLTLQCYFPYLEPCIFMCGLLSFAFLSLPRNLVQVVTSDKLKEIAEANDDLVLMSSALKGELVKVFANYHKKITCDPEMQGHIEKTLYSGHASYKVLSMAGFLDIWEPATLAIKRDGYSIKCSGPNGPVVTEKFYPTTQIKITFEEPTEFTIFGSNGVQRVLRADNNSQDISCLCTGLGGGDYIPFCIPMLNTVDIFAFYFESCIKDQ